MKRRRIKRNKHGGAPKWMVTYSDMVTLILVFFILLFSMSQIDLVKFEAISESFRNRMILDFYPSAIPVESPASSHLENGKRWNKFEVPLKKGSNDQSNGANPDDSLDKLMKDVEGYLNKNELNHVISANRTERGVVLVLQESILFDSGEATILTSGTSFLKKIGELLSQMTNNVKVEGHTDSRPISSHLYPSNWELSGARASSVTRYLITQHDLQESRFTIVGYSDTRPLEPNTTLTNMSKNRRVEIVILEDHQEQDEEVSS